MAGLGEARRGRAWRGKARHSTGIYNKVYYFGVITMASKSFRNIIAIISLCEGCAILTWDYHKDRPRHKVIEKITVRVREKCKAAFDLWFGSVDFRELKSIERQMLETERAAFAGVSEREDITTYTSLCLGLLDDVLKLVNDPVRNAALNEVHAAMWQLHKYFDRRLNQWSQYERAGWAIVVWQTRMAA